MTRTIDLEDLVFEGVPKRQLEETLHGALLLTAHIVKTQKLIQVYLSSTT